MWKESERKNVFHKVIHREWNETQAENVMRIIPRKFSSFIIKFRAVSVSNFSTQTRISRYFRPEKNEP